MTFAQFHAAFAGFREFHAGPSADGPSLDALRQAIADTATRH